MVYDEVNRNFWLDHPRILLHGDGCVPHCSEVNKRWNTGQILHEDARDFERILLSAGDTAFHVERVRISESVTALPSLLRSNDSSSILIRNWKSVNLCFLFLRLSADLVAEGYLGTFFPVEVVNSSTKFNEA